MDGILEQMNRCHKSIFRVLSGIGTACKAGKGRASAFKREDKEMKSIKWTKVLIGLGMATAALLELLFKKIGKAASDV